MTIRSHCDSKGLRHSQTVNEDENNDKAFSDWTQPCSFLADTFFIVYILFGI